MVVQDGVVKSVNAEPDGTGLTCSLAEKIQVWNFLSKEFFEVVTGLMLMKKVIHQQSVP